jgi:sporulation protein YlmC with PRC-barrel domain
MATEVERLIGKDVYGMSGNDVGEIENLLIDPNGRVQAAIIEFGGFLGIGDNEVAVPWDQLKITADRVMINMSEEQIRAQPRWTRDRPGAFAEYRPFR